MRTIIGIFISIASLHSLPGLSVINEREKTVTSPVLSCYHGPYKKIEDIPLFKKNSTKQIPGLLGGCYFYTVTNQALLNEVVNYLSDFENSGFCCISAEEYSIGIAEERDLIPKPEQHSELLSHITVEPLVDLEKGDTIITVSMGTRFQVIDEVNERLCVRLPGEEIAWVNKSSLSRLDELFSLSNEKKRARIISQARKLLGQPYKWGGRSALEGNGFDCAGFVQIVFLTAGIEVNRPVEIQYEKATPLSIDELQPGDVLFTLDTTSNQFGTQTRAIHVMVWAGNNMLIEASTDSMTVREATVEEVCHGFSLESLPCEKLVEGNHTYNVVFGRLF